MFLNFKKTILKFYLRFQQLLPELRSLRLLKLTAMHVRKNFFVLHIRLN